jgi:GNAT superfamily N-acetyltransferase
MHVELRRHSVDMVRGMLEPPFPGLTGVRLVDFRAERLDELVAMWRASFEAGVGIVDPHPISQQREYFLNEVVPRNTVRLALLDDELVGFVAASPVSVTQLFVRIGRQRCGIGTKLLDWAKAQSAGSLWLYTFARNGVARAFYVRNGFVAIANGFEPSWQLDDVKYQWSAAGSGSLPTPPSLR